MAATKPNEMIALQVLDNPSCAPPATVVRPTSTLLMRVKAMSDETRMTLLLTLLNAERPVCVCNLLPGTNVGQATVSHHLKILREAGLVMVEKRGIWAHYAVVPEMVAWIHAVVADESDS